MSSTTAAEPLFIFDRATAVRQNGEVAVHDISWSMREGETWAIVGPTGSGKTALAETLLGRHRLAEGSLVWPLLDRLRASGTAIAWPADVLQYVSFKEDSWFFSYARHYYQQRFNFIDAQDDHTLDQFLHRSAQVSEEEIGSVSERLGIASLRSLSLIKLSNGQMRRTRIARALLAKPELLILDDPFMGLDESGRLEVQSVLGELAGNGLSVILITRGDAIPEWVTHVLELDVGGKARIKHWEPARAKSKGFFRRLKTGLSKTRSVFSGIAQLFGLRGKVDRDFLEKLEKQLCLADVGTAATSEIVEGVRQSFLDKEISDDVESFVKGKLRDLLSGPSTGLDSGRNSSNQPIIELRDVTVEYGDSRILDRLTWTVREGERWAVLGPNGSGKTTLLSLICADHPQAYSNDVRLFGVRRGSGESIWEIKERIGLVSPELHLYFTQPLTAAETAATGFFDVVTSRRTTEEQRATVRDLFVQFEIASLAARQFAQLSTGEQRLVLFIRALVKRPPLLILDEPFQALDAQHIAHARNWLDRHLTAEQTLLFVTHFPEEIPSCVDRVLRLERGRIKI